MIKCICDHCGKVSEMVFEKELPPDFNVVSLACLEGKPYQLCNDCIGKWEYLKEKIHEENIERYVEFLTARHKDEIR